MGRGLRAVTVELAAVEVQCKNTLKILRHPSTSTIVLDTY